MNTQRLRWIVLILALCVSFSLHSQYNLTAIQKVEDKYDDLGATFQVVINPMVEDSLGYIWIGSKKGLCRYSGSTINCFKHIATDPTSLRSNNIENLFLDSEHLIWVAILGKGIDVFNIRGEKVKEYRYEAENLNSLRANRVWGMFEDGDGYVWISYFSGGLTRYDRRKEKFDHFSIDSEEFLKTERPKTVVKVLPHADEKHTYWLSTTRGLVKFNTRTQAYDHFMFSSKTQPGLTESTFNRDVLHSVWNRDMIMDREGILWLSNFGGVVRFDPSDNSYEVLFYNEGDFTKDGVGLFEINDSTILASVKSGFVFIDKKTRKVKTLSSTDGYGEAYYLFTRFFESSGGCLYMISAASKGTGIHKVCKEMEHVQNVSTGEYLETILATENYIHYYDKENHVASVNILNGNKVVKYLGKRKVYYVKSMYDLGGDTILIATTNDLFKYHPSGYLILIDPLVIDNTYRFESLLVDSDGDIWSGRQRDGIYVYDVSDDTVIHYNQRSTPRLVYQDYISSIMEDSEGDIWICTESGWTIFDKNSLSTRNYNPENIAAQFGIDLKVITDIVEAPNGYFYIADKTHGIIIWDKATESVISTIDSNDGLAVGPLYDLNLDGDLLWISKQNGLSVIDSKTNSVRNFGPEVGVKSPIYSSSSDDYGNLYVAHDNGYFKIDKSELLDLEDQASKPVFTAFKLYETSIDSLIFTDKKITLSHNENFFTFDFGSLNYYNSKEEKYQYRLEGVDKSWIDAKGRRTKGYTDLRPGSYVFNVRVKTTGDWSEPIKKQITIHPAWYQTWWFYAGVLALVLCIGYLLIKNYIKNKEKEIAYEKRFAQLETMILKSQMNPHFIFNSLNSIRYLFMVDKKEKGLKYITKFAKLLRTTLHHGEQALISLVDEIELTELFIQLEQLRFDDEFSFTADYGSNDGWRALQIPPFVIQPIVENAFWHGLSQSKEKEKNITIRIESRDKTWWIHILDNGVGMKASKSIVDTEVNKKKSYGLSIIRERFELINKTEKVQYAIQIEERKDGPTGTQVSIQITEK